jgi:hypothetical protein
MSSTLSLQSIADDVKSYPELNPLFGAGGWTQRPFMNIANDVMQRILAQSLDWKWNRAYVPSILTVALQQDYVTQVTNLGWLESAWRIDINNSTNNANLAPKPIFTMESVRDLGQTAYQANPFNVSYIPNSLAFMGQWNANTVYGCGYGQSMTPITPIQQFIDGNGNILYINSSVLNLSINSPGFSNQPINLGPSSPYGTTGNVQPSATKNAAAGTTVLDGTVTWTVANPNGYAMRLAPLPALSGLAWLIIPVYQMKPPTLTSLLQTIAPIPDEYAYLFRQGILAMLYEHAGSKMASQAYAKWEEALMIALRGADRERDDTSFFPSESLMGGGPYKYGMPIGAAWPFDYWGQ